MDFGEDYQPLDIGRYWEYQVKEHYVFGEGNEENSIYFIRDEVESFFFNAQNEQVYVLKRQVSADQQRWQQTGNYSLQFKNNTLVRNFNNLLTVNLIFPPAQGLRWDGMVLNANAPEKFEIDFMGSITLGSQVFPDSLRVLQEDDDDKITLRDKRYEVYAKKIGMVEQYHEVFHYCSRDECLGEQIIDSGMFRHLTIVGYGKI
jgi:hypothetical protein